MAYSILIALLAWSVAASAAVASPAEDLELYQSYFLRRFPGLGLQDFANGAYAVDRFTRENWIAIEDFPPYDPSIDRGEEMWRTPFSNGRGYADCFDGNPAQRKNYPTWEPERKELVTLELAINRCREVNGEPPLDYGRGPITRLLAYMAYESRGQVTRVAIPLKEPGAVAAYEAGKRFYFQRRGQLNFACSNCHMESAGQHLRTDTISPSLGQTSSWPTYRLEWGELGTLHRRFAVCNELIRAKPFPLQSPQYRNLEFFLTHMSNGVPYNGPASRK